MTRWLVVRAADRELALSLAVLDEVVEIPPALPAPGRADALRGVVPVRGRLVPLVHLAAALGIGALGPVVGAVGLVVRADGRRLVLEVDEAVDLADARDEGLPRGWQGSWAAGALRLAHGVVPIVDVEWLVERLVQGAEGTTATA